MREVRDMGGSCGIAFLQSGAVSRRSAQLYCPFVPFPSSFHNGPVSKILSHQLTPLFRARSPASTWNGTYFGDQLAWRMDSVQNFIWALNDRSCSSGVDPTVSVPNLRICSATAGTLVAVVASTASF